MRGATLYQVRQIHTYAFQSTHPLRGATYFNIDLTADDGLFQSTHPLRGATLDGHSDGRGLGISIHAPLAGCDGDRGAYSFGGIHFNPRTPCGVRHGRGLRALCVPSRFQSTHPLRGATPPSLFHLRRRKDFNPRTPCGVRPIASGSGLSLARFQSTHPLRGATPASGKTTYVAQHISIHAPLAGCDFEILVCFPLSIAISIHAPLAGCDKCRCCMRSRSMPFQSTHPLRGATRTAAGITKIIRISIHAPLAGCDRAMAVADCKPIVISIHAPLAGCDVVHFAPYIFALKFQSTHPLRGATCRSALEERGQFISIHAPLAGCDIYARYSSDRQTISIHAPLAGCDSENAQNFLRILR